MDVKAEGLAALLDKISSTITLTLWKHFSDLSPQDRDDIEQEVRIKIWKSLATGKKFDNPSLYVRKMTYSTAIDCVRRLKRAPAGRYAAGTAAEEAPASAKDAPDYGLERMDLRRILEEALGMLIGTRRTVVKMHLAGLHLEEIARQLGWSSNRVRHLLYRGLEDLRSRLKERGIEYEPPGWKKNAHGAQG